MSTSALKISHLTVNYERLPALWDISFEIPCGTMTAIIGPNGAGKSTLLKAALGLIKPVSGNVLFFGSSLKKERKRIAYVPQRESVDWDFPITVFDLVLMGCYGKVGLFRFPGKAEKELAYQCLAQMEIEHLAQRQISELSGGQQQRAFVARSLCQNADIYLFDEPFAGIDFASTSLIYTHLKKLKGQGKTIFVVHHDLESVAAHYDWAVLLNLRLVAAGEVKSVFTKEMIERTYGSENTVLDAVVKLKAEKALGCG